MNRMKNAMAPMRQSQTNQQPGTPKYGEVRCKETIPLTDMALSGEVKQPSIDELERCNTELTESLESLGSIARVKSTANRSVVAALFKKRTKHKS